MEGNYGYLAKSIYLDKTEETKENYFKTTIWPFKTILPYGRCQCVCGKVMKERDFKCFPDFLSRGLLSF